MWQVVALFAGAALAEGLTRRARVPGYKSDAFRAGRTAASHVHPIADIIIGEVTLGKQASS